jgi:hypothetical protein
MKKKRTPTPQEKYRATLAKRDAAHKAADEEFEATALTEIFGDLEKLLQAHEAKPRLSREQWLEVYKSLKALPTIVLGIYETERAIAEKQKKENPDQESSDEPSDIAYEEVGKVIGVGEDRVKALCHEAREQIKKGWPTNMKLGITAAEFDRMLRGKPSF